MTENNKREYDAPMVELIEARVEKGFQVSGGSAEPHARGANEALSAGSGSFTGNDFD